MDYKIVTAGTVPELENKVREAMKEGWACAGGLNRSASGTIYNTDLYFQAMVRTDDNAAVNKAVELAKLSYQGVAAPGTAGAMLTKDATETKQKRAERIL